MLRKLSLPILLFLVGLLGSAFPMFFGRDGATLIIVGFGFGSLQLYNRVQEGFIDPSDFGGVKILILIVSIIAIASISFNAYRFITNFNKVMVVGYIVVQIWVTYLIFSIMKQKNKK